MIPFIEEPWNTTCPVSAPEQDKNQTPDVNA